VLDVPGPASSLRSSLSSLDHIVAGLRRRFHWRDGNHTPAATTAGGQCPAVVAPQHVIGCYGLQRLPCAFHQQLPILRHRQFLTSNDHRLHGFACAGRFCLLLCNHSGECGKPGKRIFQHRHQCADTRAVSADKASVRQLGRPQSLVCREPDSPRPLFIRGHSLLIPARSTSQNGDCVR
jgi:hypothetical protein